MSLGNSEWLRGDEVVVERGKKFPIGLEGKAFWFGPSNYGKNRCGLELADGSKIFIDVGNVFNKSLNARRETEAKIASEKRAALAAAVKLAESRYGVAEYGKESMAAYGGSTSVSMEIFDLSRSDKEIEADIRLLFPVWSGGAACRWRSGIYNVKVDRAAKVVSFEDHYSMAD